MGYYGDPGSMRAEAASARLKAEQISALAARVQTQAQSIDFEGPAADAFRELVAGCRQRVEAAAAELESVSSLLLSAAATAEEEIARQALLEQQSQGAV